MTITIIVVIRELEMTALRPRLSNTSTSDMDSASDHFLPTNISWKSAIIG